MKGHLSKGLNVAEARISSSLQRVCRDGYQSRRTNTDRTNPALVLYIVTLYP